MAGRALATLVVLGVVVFVVLNGVPAFVTNPPVTGLSGHTVDTDNPYRESELVVGIDADGSRAFAPLVERATAYWEQNSARYADYPVNFSVRPDATDPDIRVAFVPRIGECGQSQHAAGCSPKITNPLQTIGVVNIQVLADLSKRSTVHVLKHELGHALGLGHHDAPHDLMASHAHLTKLHEPDAENRTLSWPDPDFTVAVDRSGVPDGAWNRTDEQLADALGYYERGADGRIPKNVSFRRVLNASAADVLIRFGKNASACGSDRNSCAHIEGTNPDGDGDLETHTHLTVVLDGVNTSAVGWTIAHWLGRGFGLDRAAVSPALRANATATTRTGAWWR